jgi:hypothetical protein
MPWMNTDPSKQRQQFYRDYASGQWSMTAELFELLAFRRRQVLARGWKETPDWFFCSDVGSSIDPRNFSRIWERLRRRA